ncbi:SecDF P1 head subdomain-containing protein [Sphingopyxis sp. PET50]|uniref:SecDF P1 head subdomain-containing protein n=1 Tax=Sphingopyxis sp. PET50 TaxID=2976533 RepID=UPI0021AFE659|nr:hypothetical protein [Sphingopyxis sp. PET50]
MKLTLLSMLALATASPAIERESLLAAPLVVAFKEADSSIHRVGMCLGPQAAYESEELDALDRRLDRLLYQATVTWGGNDISMQAAINKTNDSDEDVDCAANDITAMVEESRASLDRLENSLNDHLAAFDKGVWMGSVALCGGSPVKTEFAQHNIAGQEALLITLDGPAVTELAELTEASVGYPLALRVDGKIVVAPSINEPLLGGQFQIVGPDKPELERIASLLA